MSSETGYSLAHKYSSISHFCSVIRDFAKKLPSLIDFWDLQCGQNQPTPSVKSLRVLSLIGIEHLHIQYYNYSISVCG